ncbi:hypothetical protein ACSQ67_023725 [Phaseolus vulgaris]
MWRDPGAPADSFYETRPECTDVPKSRFRIKAGKTLSARKWHAAFSPEGYLDIGKTLSRIHRGVLMWFVLDRTLVFYEKKENLSKLWDILSVYARIDSDVGYGQGMSDLCSPMIILLNDEADAFWCFERLMRRLMMWALEYDPDLFWIYEEDDDKSEETKGRMKSLRHYGKYERENMKNGAKNGEDPTFPISVFLVASVLKEKSAILLQQARGLDDVVKVSLIHPTFYF